MVGMGWRRGIWRGLMCAAATAICASALSPPLVVRATATSSGVFEASVTLEQYPCPSSCSASINGHYAGVVDGIESGGGVYAAVFPDPTGGAPSLLAADLGAVSIAYSDNCPVMPTTPALTEFGSGTVTVTGGALIDSTHRVVEHGITLVGTWSWNRAISAAGIIVTFDTVEESGGATIATASVLGAGAAVFTPTIGTCAAPSPNPIIATAAGSITDPA